MLEVPLYEQKRRRYSAFATVCSYAVLTKLSVLSSAVYVFFFPKFFILVTASPFYAARRDKNGGEDYCPATCPFLLLQGMPGTVSAGVSRLSRPQAVRAKRSAYLISFPLNSAPDGAE